MEGIGDIESFSKAIPLPRHLATALEGQTADLERVHMVITAERAATVQEHNEGLLVDVATELPEIQRALFSMYLLAFSLTSLQATIKSFQPQESLLPRQPSQRSIFTARLVQIKLSMMEDTRPTLRSQQSPRQSRYSTLSSTYLFNLLTTLLFNQPARTSS